MAWSRRGAWPMARHVVVQEALKTARRNGAGFGLPWELASKPGGYACRTQPPYAENRWLALGHTSGGVGGMTGAIPSVRPDLGGRFGFFVISALPDREAVGDCLSGTSPYWSSTFASRPTASREPHCREQQCGKRKRGRLRNSPHFSESR